MYQIFITVFYINRRSYFEYLKFAIDMSSFRLE